MAKGKSANSWLEQVASLDDPTPRELDPEDNAPVESGSESGDESADDRRAHYVDVGKSKLREHNKPQQDLGLEYAGAQISREVLEAESDEDPFGQEVEQEASDEEEFADPDDDLVDPDIDGDDEIESDEAFESGDDQRFEGYTFRGSRQTRPSEEEADFEDEETDGLSEEAEDVNVDVDVASSDDGTGSSDQEKGETSDVSEKDQGGSSAESDSDDTSISDGPAKTETDDRAALRKMMAEEQKTVAASLSKAAKADIEKGRAIKKQRTTFDTLLNTRIKLQKALIATNSMAASKPTPSPDTEHILAAETAALNLWNSLSSLRSSLQPPTSKKRSFSATTSTSSSALWNHMQSQESDSLPNRRANLIKWSQKTNPITALPRANKFSQTPTQQPLTDILDHQLSGTNGEKLLHKTQIPRSCAPLQAASQVASDPAIYDDAEFYTLLLRELVDQRMADSSNPAPVSNGTADLPSLPSKRELKIKKQVDTKASKGRKMRYTVHEKLQNFMAPDDRGSWGERQRNELFGSLLGRRVNLGEDEGVGDVDGEEVVDVEGGEGGLRLFG